jgi:hypothetical protein
MNRTPDEIIKEQKRLEEERSNYENLKKTCVQFAYPGRSDQWQTFGINWKDKGKPNRDRHIYDPTAIKGLDVWSSGLMSHFMPKEVPWFLGEMADRRLKDSKRVKKWLQDTDDHLRSVLNRSYPNYYEQKLISIKDAGAIGDSYMYIDPDKESDKLMFMCPHPRQLYIKRDFWGRIILIHDKFPKTMEEVVGEYGEQALSETQKITYETDKQAIITVIHEVIKNTDYNPDSIGVKNMRWQHFYINVEGKKQMHRTGSPVLNPVPWNLNRPSHEMYGRGIVSQMLMEIITVNFIAKDMLTAGQLAARPPMLISAAVKNKLDLGAGGKTFVNSKEMLGLKMGDLIARLIDSSGYPFGSDQQVRWQAMVEERFGIPLFLALNIDATAKTAYETRERKAERTTLMAPFLGTLSGTTDMELDRVYSLELQAGRAPEPPMEVLESQNKNINIEYIGPITQLLKQYYETGNLINTIMNIKAALEVAPDSEIIVEGDELMRKILRSSNAPEEIIRDEAAVAELRAIAQQQEEQRMMLEVAERAAKSVPNLSKKIEADSVLSNSVKAA